MVTLYIFQAGRRIVDLFEGFKDGHNLLSLLEVLSHEALVGVDNRCCCVPILMGVVGWCDGAG